MQKIEITVNVIIHSTEDITKFYKSFEELFGITQENFTIQESQGHYNNPITILHAKIIKEQAKTITKTIISSLSTLDKQHLIDALQPTDDSNLYLRIGKQEFVAGQIVPKQADAIKLKIYTPTYNKKEVINTYKKLLQTC